MAVIRTLQRLTKQLKQRMQDYFQTMWSLNHGIDPIEVSSGEVGVGHMKKY